MKLISKILFSDKKARSTFIFSNAGEILKSISKASFSKTLFI